MLHKQSINKLTNIALKTFILAFLLLPTVYIAQSAETDLDPDFDAGTGADNGVINDAILQSDGKIIVVGSFTSFNGDTSLVRIARLNTDGSIDNTFDPGTGANGTVQDVFVLDDGKILIGGDFTTYNSVTRNRLARLNSDGSLDTDFDPGTGPGSSVRAIDVQADGKYIIGGTFTTYGGVNKKYAARVNTDGTLDTSFAQTSNEIFNAVMDVHVLADQKVIITGWFSGVSGNNRGRIAKLLTNGNLDTTFGSGTFNYGASGVVNESQILSDGKLILVGEFSLFDNVSRRRIAVANSNGFLNTSFDPGPNGASGGGNYISTVDVQQDGKYVIGGSFTQYDSVNRNRIARVNTDGTLDTTFDTSVGATTTIEKVLVQPDGKILVMGNAMTALNGANTGSRGITRLVGPDITAPSLDTATASSTELVLTYDEPLDASSTPDTTDFIVSINGATSSPSAVEVSSSTVTLTLSPAAENGDTVTVSYASSSNPIQDEAGNIADNFTNQAVTNNTPDSDAPTLQTAAATSTTLVLTYSEDLNESSTPDTTDFVLSINGATSSPSVVDVSGSAVTLTLSPSADFEDVVTLSYTAGSNPIEDEAGNSASNLTDQAVTNNTPDTTAPVFQSATASSTTLVLYYDEELDETSTPTTTDFVVNINGSPISTSLIVVSGTTTTLTLGTASVYGDIVTISYTAGSDPLQDNAGNNVSNLSSQAVTNNTAEVIVLTATPNPNRTTVTGGYSSSVRTGNALTIPNEVKSIIDLANNSPIPELSKGDQREAVRTLQKFLNKLRFTVAETGPGSPGYETDFFGEKTEAALIKLQQTFNLPANGLYNGPTKILLGDIIQLLTLIGEF